MKSNLRVVFMGTPAFSVGIAEAIRSANIDIVGIVTVADKPAGRGQLMHESAVKQFAVQHAIPVLQPLKLKDPDFLIQLEKLNADIFVVVAFRMLPDAVWKMPAKGTFNLHASLLPDYRGAAPINWTIMNGDTETGLSTFFIDEEIDTGNVIMQSKMKIGQNETAGELHDRMIIEGGQLVVKSLLAIEEGIVTPIPQSEFKSSLNRPAPKLFKENTQIDWSKSVKDIHHFICGLSPYPNAWTKWINTKGEIKSVKLFQSSFEFGASSIENTFTNDKESIYYHGLDGILSIKELQLEGKKRMSAKDWLVGNSISDWKIYSENA